MYSLKNPAAYSNLLNLKIEKATRSNLLILHLSNKSDYNCIKLIQVSIVNTEILSEEIFSFKPNKLETSVKEANYRYFALCAYAEKYQSGKFKQSRLIICSTFEDTISQYILTVKKGKIFVNDYTYYAQVTQILNLIPTYNPDGEGTYLVMVFKSIIGDSTLLNCS